ncbi:ribosomal protein L21-like protein [Biscogniauxia mediterranea]|nr:ribosomal protein L21-like protein [Biscogniauxia mediterranea]
MSRSLLRSVLELRTPITRLPPTFLLPVRARTLSTTPQQVEPEIPPHGVPAAQTRAPLKAPKSSKKPSKPSAAAATTTTTTTAVATTAPFPPPPPPPFKAGLSDSVSQLLPLLRAQPGHYVTVHIHGRPYLVTAGDEVRLPFLMAGVNPGDVLRLDRASVLGSRDYTLKGSPWVDGSLFECRAVVLGVESEPLRVKIKTKRRNRRSQRVKSKHRYTILRISELKVLGP